MSSSAISAGQSRRRPVARWLGPGGGALLISATAHLAAAVSVGAILRTVTGPSEPSDSVEVAIVSAPITPEPKGTVAATENSRVPRRSFHQARGARAMAARFTTVAGSRAMAPRSSWDGEVKPVRFAMFTGAVSTGSVTPASRLPASAPNRPDDEEALVEGDVSVPARLLSGSALAYPAGARQAEIEADLPLEIIVEPTGLVSSARALTRAGYGLDEAALQAVRGYRFSPALRAGRPVRVRMRWTVQFRLR